MRAIRTKVAQIPANSNPAAACAPARVGDYFESGATFWKTVYSGGDVYALIYQERLARVLAWIDELALPAGARALDIGCGAGLLSVALAQRRLSVTAIDLAPAMLAETRELARASGVPESVCTSLSDVGELPFPTGTFDLAVALGVLPWAPSPDAAAREMSRVLRPGGHLIVTVDNRWRFHEVADPLAWASLLKNALARACKFALARPQLPGYRRTEIRQADGWLERGNVEILRAATLGFGPFRIISRCFPAATGVAAHRKLQTLADRGLPLVRSTGSHYIVLGRKQTG